MWLSLYQPVCERVLPPPLPLTIPHELPPQIRVPRGRLAVRSLVRRRVSFVFAGRSVWDLDATPKFLQLWPQQAGANEGPRLGPSVKVPGLLSG